MHPADQIMAFSCISASGKTTAEIGGLMGYSTTHVQKFLRLAGIALALLAELAEDNINVDQQQALSACCRWDVSYGQREAGKGAAAKTQALPDRRGSR
jgi:ParB-like chromosome segregation protein Spo0J